MSENSFNLFCFGFWLNKKSKFTLIQPYNYLQTWILRKLAMKTPSNTWVYTFHTFNQQFACLLGPTSRSLSWNLPLKIVTALKFILPKGNFFFLGLPYQTRLVANNHLKGIAIILYPLVLYLSLRKSAPLCIRQSEI